MARVGIVVCVSITCLSIIGCGGSDTKTVTQVRTQTSAGPLTKAEYISQADAICTQYSGEREQFQSEADRFRNIRTEEQAHQAADFLRSTKDKIAPEYQALQSLQPPPADAQVLGELISLINGQLGEIDSMADAVDSLDAGEIRAAATQITKDGAQAQGIAQGYGFKVCGQGY